MDWKQFVSSLVGSLAWPLAILGLVCILWFTVSTDSRQSLIDRLREIGPGGAKFDEKKLEEAGGEVKRVTQSFAHSAALSGEGTLSASGVVGSGQPSEADAKTLRDTQRLIAAAAKWGWIRAGRDAQDFPYPLVTWEKDGAKIVGSKTVLPGDTVTYAPGSFIDPNTGQPNTSAHTFTVDDPDPL